MTSVLAPIVALVGKGSVETLRNGFRARVYCGKDPITGRQTYLRGQSRRDREQAERDCVRLTRLDVRLLRPCVGGGVASP
jgi:hypothetical protein